LCRVLVECEGRGGAERDEKRDGGSIFPAFHPPSKSLPSDQAHARRGALPSSSLTAATNVPVCATYCTQPSALPALAGLKTPVTCSLIVKPLAFRRSLRQPPWRLVHHIGSMRLRWTRGSPANDLFCALCTGTAPTSTTTAGLQIARHERPVRVARASASPPPTPSPISGSTTSSSLAPAATTGVRPLARLHHACHAPATTRRPPSQTTHPTHAASASSPIELAPADVRLDTPLCSAAEHRHLHSKQAVGCDRPSWSASIARLQASCANITARSGIYPGSSSKWPQSSSNAARKPHRNSSNRPAPCRAAARACPGT